MTRPSDQMVERLAGLLRWQEDSGRRTLGGGSVSHEGCVNTWGGLPIMRLRNPDGPEAADALEALLSRIAALEAEGAALREALASACSAMEPAGTCNGNGLIYRRLCALLANEAPEVNHER